METSEVRSQLDERIGLIEDKLLQMIEMVAVRVVGRGRVQGHGERRRSRHRRGGRPGRALALEWGEHGIRVNALAPGFISG